MRRFITHWFPALLWAAIIFSLSSVPSLDSGLALTWDLVLRKIAHAAEFGLLAILVVRALNIQKNGAWILAGLTSILYAASDEWHQRFVPGREGNIWDVVIDGLGVCIGLLILWRWSTSRTARVVSP